MNLFLFLLLLLMQQTACQQRGLFPAILNLASNADIASNATCGEPEAEVYCKLVEHVPGRLIKNPHCPKCDGNSILSKERHPITNAIDGTNRWWQSPSIKNGRQFHWVTITLDLKQVFQVAYIIIKAANSPRPGNWILERSMDGVTFDPWQFYAISDSECLSRYDVAPRLGPPTYKGDTEVICTSYYSRLEPLEHGEIHTSLINSRPGADDLTSELLNFTSARFIRLRLQRIRTLNADLMTLSARDPRDIDPIVTRRYYYSIKDISVGGMCICFGHARNCPLDPVTKKLQCVCEHNTCGTSCNHCCPGYHQLPWQPGTLSEGNTCQKCNCHNKASDCFYNQTVADLRLSVNVRGVRHGGGVCLDCQQNTAGVNCETCADRYFRPEQVSPYSERPCVECDCDLSGAESSVCASDDTSPGASAGQCACKTGFAGRRCDRCAFGFRDFPLCARCECHLAGSINRDPCDDCICKANVMGGNCDLCKSGFYNLQAANPLGCTDCFCFGVSDVCESSTWSSAQVVSADAWLRPSSALHEYSTILGNELPASGNVSSGEERELWWEAPDGFLGNKLSSYGGLLNYSVVYLGSLDGKQRFVPAQTDVVVQGNGRALRLSPPHVLFLSPLAEHPVAVRMLPDQFVDEQTGVQVSRDDLLSVFAEVASLRVEVHLNNSADGAMRLAVVSLDAADSQSASGVPAVAMETCECPWGYSGTSCESCLAGFYRVGGVLFGGNCMQCECHDHASRCDVNGVCLGCVHHTTGPRCDRCLPGFYGDATEGTADDCRRCACPLTEPSNSFSPTCVLDSFGHVSCDQCQEGYAGSKCHECSDGFYGNPQVVGGTCARCQCNGNVDAEEAGHCDNVSGECLRCRHNTAGRRCEICASGFYGDAVQQKNCQDCDCDVNGSLSSVCDAATGQCACRDNVTGRACDRCQPGFFAPAGGSGCVACDCDPKGSLGGSCDDGGRCRCVAGVDGDRCDRCGRGYFGFRDDGCTACTCNHTGGNCHPQTGECVCPAHTEGDSCGRCEAGYWGRHPVTGCKPCDCSAEGSSAPQCELTNGQCPCREGFSGRSCDLCAPGHYGYPACSPCGCDVAGTEDDSCNRTLGVCDCRRAGECACKAAVSGRRCQECISGFFALSWENPDGCSPCFCSGLSEDCEERAGLVRAHITLARSPALLPLVSQSNLEGVISGVYQQGGDMLLDTRQLNSSGLSAPLYWRLPPQFEGQQLLSYGGVLSYVVTFYADDAEGLANQEPQVLMRGGALRKLLIYTDMVAPDNGIRTQHDIRLTEHKWRYFNSVSEKAVSRSDFLSVLNDLQYVIVKASYGTRLQQSRISNITMETAREEQEAGESGAGPVARLIESCFCPAGYAGSSCQECAAGFFRQPLSELPPQARKSAFVRPCVACRCNEHSSDCDARSGRCQDCQHHTSGRSCELCSPGYYGNVSGSISDCSPCACPLQDNSFSPTCESEGTLGDFRCTSCLTGYEGRYCERCSLGYYGNPSLPGGACTPCGCSEWGSLHPLCDQLTGRCRCNAGVKGATCDQCDERHVLEGSRCWPCDDDCTGGLLDDLERTRWHWRAANVSGAAMAPYRQLVALNKQTASMQLMFAERTSSELPTSGAEEDLTQLTSDLSLLTTKATNVSHDCEQVGVAANDSLSHASRLMEKIQRVQDRIEALAKEAEQLNGAAEAALETANRTRLLDQTAAMLESLRAVNLSAAASAARHQLSLSESLMKLLQHQFLPGAGNRLRPVAAGLDASMQKLQEVKTRLEDAEKENVQTHLVMNATNARLSHHKAAHQNVTVAYACVEDEMEAGQLLLNDVLNLTGAFTNISATDVLGGELDQWRPLLRKKVEALVMGLKSTDSLERVYQAESHAHLLRSHALSLHGALSSVWNASQNSSQLVSLDADIADGVDEARRAASDARKSAGLAANMTSQSEQLLSAEGGARLSAIAAVLNESHAIAKTAEDARLKITAVTTRQRMLSKRVRNASGLLHQPIRELQSLSNGSLQPQEARSQAAIAHASLQEALQHLNNLQQQLRDSSSVVEKSNLSAAETNQLMTHAYSTANEAQRRLEEAEHRTQRLSEKIKPLNMLGESLSRNMSDIRELIEQARRQAASIKVAVQADGGCVRSYRPQIQSSNFNTLTLTLKTKSPNNLLFYVGSKTTVEFLAVEMHNGKVSLLWDVGSGSTRLEYPGLNIANNRWTVINATRLGSRGFLTVHQLEAAPSQTAMAASPGPARVLHIDNGTVVHIGGLADDTQGPPALQWSKFQGCLGEASLNEKNIGLWNYVSRQGQCGGCFSSPQAEETAFHFDGSGFSLVQKSLRATSTSIVLLFKTLSPGGLLLYLASNNTRDFLSIELVEGCVRLTFDLGSGPLVLTSSRKYNTGVWYKVTLQRNRRKGYLSIMAADQSSEKEVLEAESPGSASDLNRSDLDPIYIGGLPASRPIRRQVVSRSYVGCIKNVEIARLNFDLLRDAYGVRKGCVVEAVRSVSMFSGGFVQIAPHALGQEAEFLFSFKSNNQSGILLAALTENHSQRRHFLSVHLLHGSLEAELGEKGADGRRVAVTAAEGGSFADGNKHSVIVNINRKSLSIQVDEGNVKSASLLPGGFSRLSTASFFVGGLPSGDESGLPIRLQKISKLFRGCVQHLVLGDRLVDLSAAVRYEGAALDSCLLEEQIRGAVLPEDQDAEPTLDPSQLSAASPIQLTPADLTCTPEAELSFLPTAAHFGSSRHSHMTFTIDPVAVRKSVSLRLSLRTRAQDGLLLLLSDANQMDFAILRLAAGRALMSADLGKGAATAASSVAVNDGKWHTVTADVSRRSVWVSVDASAPDSVAVRGNQLDVNSRLYLGGLPRAHNTRRINVTTSLRGCLHSVSVNGVMLDLSRPTSQHDVTSCFSKEETGSYFNGSGYAALMRDGYKVGSDVSVSLEFRTGQSEGVLLGISSAKVDAIGLEMIKGQVVFNVNNGAGRVWVASGGPVLCDGRWHRLLARKTKHTLSLSVDGRSNSITNPYPQSTSAETNNPVFVGGYPDGIKQNCLSIKSAFRGCLKNVHLVKSHLSSRLDLSQAYYSLGVAPDSCPAA
ncbi:laminin subunit alpha-1 [Vanacampus margaritifer]